MKCKACVSDNLSWVLLLGWATLIRLVCQICVCLSGVKFLPPFKLHGIFLLNWLVPSNAVECFFFPFLIWLCQPKSEKRKKKKNREQAKRGDKSSDLLLLKSHFCICWNEIVISYHKFYSTSLWAHCHFLTRWMISINGCRLPANPSHWICCKGCNCFAKHLNIADYSGWYDSFGAFCMATSGWGAEIFLTIFGLPPNFHIILHLNLCYARINDEIHHVYNDLFYFRV